MIKYLNSLLEDNILTISKIELWLQEYERTYHYSKLTERIENTFADIDGEEAYLPSILIPTEDEKLIELYETLGKLLKFHRNETYFKAEIEKYKFITKDSNKLKVWISKNERLGTEEYVSFLLDYLDYDKENNEYHLSIHFHKNLDLNLFIEREEFNNTIKFLEIFNSHYWV